MGDDHSRKKNKTVQKKFFKFKNCMNANCNYQSLRSHI